MQIGFLAVAALGLGASPVMADEAWNTSLGTVAWMDNIGDMAMLGTEDGSTRIFLPGLAGDVMGGRGAYDGYWTADGAADDCGMQMIDPAGHKARAWGRVVITFVNPGFPSDWAGVYGHCFDEPSLPISGTAITG